MIYFYVINNADSTAMDEVERYSRMMSRYSSWRR